MVSAGFPEEESIIALVPLPVIISDLAEEPISLKNPKLGFGINLTPLVTERSSIVAKPTAVDAEHPLDGQILTLKNTYNGLGVGANDYLSFREDDKCLRVIYKHQDAMPIKFTKVEDRSHVYTM